MKKTDVLYIHSTKNPIGEDDLQFAVMPMGIIGILNNLKSRNIEILGLNYAIEKSLDPQFDLVSTLKNIEYKILLTDLHWYEHSFGAMYVAEQSKKLCPDVPVVIGGYTSTIYATEIMDNFDTVDYIVKGDSDLPMEILVDHLLGRNGISPERIPNLVYRQNDAVMVSKEVWTADTLDNIDFLNTDFFEHAKYIPHLNTKGIKRSVSSFWLCVARGCIFNCAYCCGANANMETLFGRCNVLTRNPELVASDFVKLTKAGIRQVSPSHDFQMFGKDYYQPLFAKIREAGVKPGMYLECFQLPTKDYIDDIAETFDKNNLILVISPISGNEKLRRENGKYFSNDDFLKTIEYMLSKGITFQLYYTLNPVGETKEQFMDTYFQMSYLRIGYGLVPQQVFYQCVVIDPLAGMRNFEGICVEYNTFMDYYRYCQIPTSQIFTSSGYLDGGEVPMDEKYNMYKSIFNIS